MLRVLSCQIEQFGLGTAFRFHDPHPAFSVLAEELFQRFAHLDRHRDQDIVRQRSPLGVVLPEECTEHLVVRHCNLPKRKRAQAEQASPAHAQHRNFDLVALAVKADHVLVRLLHTGDALFFLSALDRAKLIPIDRGPFVFELAGRAFHASVDVAHELAMPPIEKPSDVDDLRAILLLVDFQHARPRASLDLILKTRPRSQSKLDVGTRSELKVPIHQPQRLPRRSSRVVRPEVLTAVWFWSADDLESRPRLLRVEPQRQEFFVVPKLHVVLGLV